MEIKHRSNSIVLTKHPDGMMDWLMPNGNRVTHYLLPKYSFPQSKQMTQGQQECLKGNEILAIDGLIIDTRAPRVLESPNQGEDLENFIITEEDRDQLELLSSI